jgi:hypothetical protein
MTESGSRIKNEIAAKHAEIERARQLALDTAARKSAPEGFHDP